MRIQADQLTLCVDDVSQSEAISAAPQYSPIALTDSEGSQNNCELVVGQDCQGQLSTSPLATFSNGQETQSVTLDSQGQQVVPVLSTGNLRSFGSKLPMQNIAISTPTERRNINLISLDLFGDISRISISGNLIASAPPIDESVISYLPAQQQSIHPTHLSILETIVPRAHAYEISAMDVLSIVASLVGLDSLEVIWDQLTNLATGEEVDIVAFSLAVLDVLTLFPPAAPLKIVTGPAKLAIKTLNMVNPKAAKYLAGVIKRIYNQAKNRDFTLVYQGIAFFIITADMMTDEEALEGLKAIGETINSTEDFLGWVEFLSLADPEILLSTAAQINGHQPQFALNPLAGLIPNAHASVTPSFGKIFGKVAKELKPQLQEQRKEAAQILKQIRKIVTEKGDDVAEQAAKMRKLVFRKNFIKGAFNAVKRGGLPKLRNWLLGYNGQRISPLTLLVVSAYLEEEVIAGNLFPESEHPFDHERNLSGLNSLFIKAVPESFSGKTVSDAHGSSYHLLQLAFVHATGNKVLGIEVTRNVPVFKSKSAVEANLRRWEGTNPYLRKVDIVTGTALHSDETWWEVKSWRSVSKTNREIKQNLRNWTFLEGKDSGSGVKIEVFEGDDVEARGQPHKQMCLDRIALENGAFLPTPEQDAKNLDYDRSDQPPISVESAPWQFHQFTAGKNKDIVNPTKPILETALVKDPRKNGGAFDPQSVSDSTAKGMINLGAAQQLMEVLKKRSFDLADEALQDLEPVLE